LTLNQCVCKIYFSFFPFFSLGGPRFLAMSCFFLPLAPALLGFLCLEVGRPPDLTSKAACFLANTAGLFVNRVLGAGVELEVFEALGPPPGPDLLASGLVTVLFPGLPSDLLDLAPSQGSGPLAWGEEPF
jgi:hypothetical protein